MPKECLLYLEGQTKFPRPSFVNMDVTQDGLVLTRSGGKDRSLADGGSEDILEIPASGLVNVELDEIEVPDPSKGRQIMNLLFYGKKDEDERRKKRRVLNLDYRDESGFVRRMTFGEYRGRGQLEQMQRLLQKLRNNANARG